MRWPSPTRTRADTGEPSDDLRSQVAFKKFCSDATGALVKLIEADAAQLSPEAAADRYQAYLDALAPALSLAAEPALVEQVQAALDRAAAISPPLVVQIASYRSATGPLLRWRARLASAEAARAKSAGEATFSFKRSIAEPLPKLIPKLSKEFEGKTIVALDLVGSRRQGLATSPPDLADTYRVRVPAEPMAANYERLRAALLCDDRKGPLTLDAAMALAATRRGDLVAAGGAVKRFQLDSYLVFLSHAGAKSPARLDRQPASFPGRLRLRVELEPAWLQQRYAFVELESP